MASVLYRGFRYTHIGGSSWRIVYPSGHKFQRQFSDEVEVQKCIDGIILKFGESGELI